MGRERVGGGEVGGPRRRRKERGSEESGATMNRYDDQLIAEFTPSQTNLRPGERKKGQEGEEGAAGRKSGGSGLEEEGKRKAEKRAER